MAIRKRGKGRWQVRVRPFPEMTLPTKEAAETVELDLKLRLKLGHLYQEKPTTFGDELDARFERKQAMGGKRGQLRPATVRFYAQNVKPWEPLRDVPIPNLRRALVEDHIAARAKVAPTAARNELEFAKAALREAASRGQLVDPGIFEIEPIRTETREAVALELEQLLVRPPGTPVVFATEKGGRYSESGFRSMWAPALLGAGLAHEERRGRRRVVVSDFRFHWLRHTAISLMARAGMRPELIAQRVGHTDGGALVYRRYRHLYSREIKDAVSALDAFLAQSASGHRVVKSDG